MKEQESLSKEDHADLVRLTREMLDLEGMVGGFELINLTPEEEALRQRCQDYVDAIKHGEEADVRTFLEGKPGKAVELERSILQKLAEKTKYERIIWKKVSVPPGSLAHTIFNCDLVTNSGKMPGVQISIRWRLRNGMWMVEEHQ